MSKLIYTSNLNKAGFIRLPDVLKIIPVGRSSWWAGIQAGRYPKGIKLGPRTTAWKVEDIEALLDKLSKDGGEA